MFDHNATMMGRAVASGVHWFINGDATWQEEVVAEQKKFALHDREQDRSDCGRFFRDEARKFGGQARLGDLEYARQQRRSTSSH